MKLLHAGRVDEDGVRQVTTEEWIRAGMAESAEVIELLYDVCCVCLFACLLECV